MVTVEVDQELCIGDEICPSMAPEIFEMNGENVSVVIDGMEELDDESLIVAARDAEDACPVDAITVTE